MRQGRNIAPANDPAQGFAAAERTAMKDRALWPTALAPSALMAAGADPISALATRAVS